MSAAAGPEPAPFPEPVMAFGPFRIFRCRRLLLEGEQPVRLGGRAFDILLALLDRAGEVVGKQELLATAWPKAVVEESSLRVQVNAVRKALGDVHGDGRYVVNVPSRGYRFVAPVSHVEAAARPGARGEAHTPRHNLPSPLSTMIGRDETVQQLCAQLARHRLVSVVGPGGMGKSTVALSTALAWLQSGTPACSDGAWFVDLSAAADDDGVQAAIASVLQLAGLAAGAGTPEMAAAVQQQRLLLVLDNCEHVIEPAARVAVHWLKAAPGLRVLATSREPLRTVGEHVHRLPALALPPAGARLTAVEAMHFSAIQLFTERAADCSGRFELADANAAAVAALCHRADGLPLAIEVLAAKVGAVGLLSLADQLDNHFLIHTPGLRTTLPRHHTLYAALDWSFGLLSPLERAVLGRIAVLPGGFSLESATVGDAELRLSAAQTVTGLLGLVEKSLLVAETCRERLLYRLSELTRAYALEKRADAAAGWHAGAERLPARTPPRRAGAPDETRPPLPAPACAA
ncbi:MAG TPA: winged helix-turn-helix domain-containing protein [Ideonella sp.]|nr:winged helix-turn-helix domain-containing protein [Ideonella sp.]